MSLLLRARNVTAGFAEAVRQHPVVAGVALGTSSLMAIIAEAPRNQDSQLVERTALVLLFWLLFAEALALVRILWGFSRRREVALSLGGGLLGIGVFLAVPDFQQDHHQLRFALFCLSALLLPAAALFRAEPEGQRGFILRCLGSGLMAGLISGAFLALAALALAGIDSLLVSLPNIDRHVAALASGAFLFLAPLLLLYYLHQDEGLGPAFERLMGALARFVFVPAIVAYELILLAYSVKIIVVGSMPRGVVSMLVSACVLLAIAVDTLLPRALGRGWAAFRQGVFALLLPFLALLWLAVYQRVAPYGITAERYLLVAAALCLSATVGWALVKRRHVLPFFAASLLGAALVSSGGPWGFHAVSVRSQFGRLEGTLRDAGLLKEGRWVRATAEPDFDTREALTSSLAWMDKNGVRSPVERLLDEPAAKIWNQVPPCDEPRECRGRRVFNGDELLRHMNVEPARSWERGRPQTRKISGGIPWNQVIAVRDDLFVGKIQCGEKGTASYPLNLGESLLVSRDCSRLEVVRRDGLACGIDDVLAGMREPSREIATEKLALETEGKGCRFKLIFDAISFETELGNRVPGKTSFSASVWLELF